MTRFTADQLYEIAVAVVDDRDGPGISIALQRDGGEPIATAVGFANLETRTPLDVGSLMNVGSVAKQFTALTFLSVTRQAGIAKSTPVRKVLTAFGNLPTDLTFDHLLLHQSGIPDYGPLLAVQGRPADEPLKQGGVLALLARQPRMIFPPGRQQQYSNSNYVLLAEALRILTDDDLPTLIRRHVLEPIGLSGAVFRTDAGKLAPNCARSYEVDVQEGGAWICADSPTSIEGPDNLYLRPIDLLVWEQVLARRTWEPELTGLLHEAATTSGVPTNFCRGRRRRMIGGYVAHGHAGSQHGNRAEVWRYPAVGLSIAACTNFPYPHLLEVHETILKEIFGARVRSNLTGRSRQTSNPPPVTEETNEIVYDAETGELWLVTMSPDEVALAGTERLIFRWSSSDSAYVNTSLRDPLRLRIDCETRPAAVLIERIGRVAGDLTAQLEMLTWARLPCERPLSWWSGEYWSDELNCSARLLFLDDSRARFVRGHGTTELIRFCATGFAGDGILLRLCSSTGGQSSSLLVQAPRIAPVNFNRTSDNTSDSELGCEPNG